jgi:GNAT superfamily N-acetyltransferase
MRPGGQEPATRITFTPSEADFTAIFRPLDDETARIIGPGAIQPVAVLLHDDAGAVTGGCWGRIVYRWLVIEMLFVPPALRGQGAGAALLRHAQAAARARNCIGIQLTRLDFQAPGFYERHGFTVFAEQPDVPPGHTCFYLLKRL